MGTAQELRAKRTLDRLALLHGVRSRVVRAGKERDVPLADVVADDLVRLSAGDQVPVDGVVRSAAGLAVDESLLTGEADPVVKQQGDEVLSGSAVVAGAAATSAAMRARPCAGWRSSVRRSESA